MPWSGPKGVGGGKLTVIKAGPGFHEEKSYDIGPDGQFSKVKPVNMMHDGCKWRKLSKFVLNLGKFLTILPEKLLKYGNFEGFFMAPCKI